MKLKSFNHLISLLVFISITSLLWAEDKIDIWNNKKINKDEPIEKSKEQVPQSNPKATQTVESLKKIEIKEGNEIQSEERNVYGIYEPANYNFSLNMWSNTKAENLRSSLKDWIKLIFQNHHKKYLKLFYFHSLTHRKE